LSRAEQINSELIADGRGIRSGICDVSHLELSGFEIRDPGNPKSQIPGVVAVRLVCFLLRVRSAGLRRTAVRLAARIIDLSARSGHASQRPSRERDWGCVPRPMHRQPVTQRRHSRAAQAHGSFAGIAPESRSDGTGNLDLGYLRIEI
jgi:hypothetical protein